LAANVKFYSDVFRGEVISQEEGYTVMNVANHYMVLATPRAINLTPENVVKRDSKIYRPDIDHLGFLYEDVTPAYNHAVSLDYKFLSPPNKIMYFEKPTLYTFAILMSPDGLQCEMYQEEGRVSSRTTYK